MQLTNLVRPLSPLSGWCSGCQLAPSLCCTPCPSPCPALHALPPCPSPCPALRCHALHPPGSGSIEVEIHWLKVQTCSQMQVAHAIWLAAWHECPDGSPCYTACMAQPCLELASCARNPNICTSCFMNPPGFERYAQYISSFWYLWVPSGTFWSKA